MEKKQKDVSIEGHSFEARIYAEDPTSGFLPVSGALSHVSFPANCRIDSAIQSGDVISHFYDPMIAKLIVHGDDREHCLARLKRALEEFVVEPIPTTLKLHQRLVDAPAIKDGSYNIRWLEEVFLPKTQNQ